jgi:hypothetical protein
MRVKERIVPMCPPDAVATRYPSAFDRRALVEAE